MKNINKHSPDQQEYLQVTATIADPPKRLWSVGKLPTERVPTVAIVGTRRPTPYGREVAYRLASELAQKGVIVVSGLALGIDSIAHQAVLDSGGTTIAIMPAGLERIYPASHRQLAQRIVENGGALISEYEPHEPPYLNRFVQRSRIVAGLSDGVLIIEASAKSGTIHTANFALEQGRPVMAVPGNITNPLSAGCNTLIATGARLVMSVQDILDEIGLSQSATQPQLAFAANAQEQAILSLIATGIRDADELQQQSKLDVSTFNQTLSMLEITGKIKALGGNQWSV